VPTITEAGAAGADFISWNGVHVPARTPKSVIVKLNTELDRLLKLPEVRERMQTLGLDPAGGTPEAFAAFVKADIARWAKVIKETGVHVE
jgi:tripartite-type tricarboxylate transporter receptor subunit TctC